VDPDQELMDKIKVDLGDYIADAAAGTPFAPALLAAITANESGGVPNATRFEPAVCAQLSRVIAGQVAAYAPPGIMRPIGAQDLTKCCYPPPSGWQGDPDPRWTPAQSHQCLINLATSWGPTQIMGWHSLELGIPLSKIVQLGTHYEVAVKLLNWFYTHYLLADRDDLGLDGIPGALLNCWNTGDPKAPTYDPDYVANGLARMALYV
jgi:hypothetical protein